MAKKVILTPNSAENEIEVSGTAPVFSILDENGAGDIGKGSLLLTSTLNFENPGNFSRLVMLITYKL